jgi:uncharacterized phage-like protein YoqJ
MIKLGEWVRWKLPKLKKIKKVIEELLENEKEWRLIVDLLLEE